MTDNDLEELFDKFVENFGGEKITPPKNTPGDYADYLFRQESPPIVAELKCLMKDGAASQQTRRELGAAHLRWVQEGLVPASEHKEIAISSDTLPHQCNEEVFHILKSPVERVLKKANKQIDNTRRYLNLPEEHGLVFIINEGGYGLSPTTLTGIVAWILERQSKEHIDCVIVLTVNMTVFDPEYGAGGRIWVPQSRKSQPALPRDFLDRIEAAWVGFLGQHLEKGIRYYPNQTPEIINRMVNEPNHEADQPPFRDIQQPNGDSVKPGHFYWQPQTGAGYFCDHADELNIVMTVLHILPDNEAFIGRFELPASKSCCFEAVTDAQQLVRLKALHKYFLSNEQILFNKRV